MVLKNKKFKNTVNSWLLFKKFSVKKSTYYRYKYITNKYIVSYFENKRISYFVNYDFSIYMDFLLKNLSSKTVSDIMIVFKSILKYISKKYNVNYKLDLISVPKSNVDEIKTLESKERNRLEMYCLNNDDFKVVGIAVCMLTGLRIGEICALKWGNINLNEKIIYVKETLQRVYVEKDNTKIIIDEHKTKAAIRRIPIPQKLFNVLQEIEKKYNFKKDYYFLTGNTKYIEPRNYERIFKRCLDICKIQKYNFHTLRHTFATNCINIGMDPKTLSVILGHSNVQITLNRYVHPSFADQKTFLDKL